MYLFFDVETTGKPPAYTLTPQNVLAWPHITQLAWAVMDEEQNIINSFCELIKPKGWTIPKEQFFIENGHSTERCEQLGVPIHDAIQKFVIARKSYPYTIAHNDAFDRMMVRAELIRLGAAKIEFKATRICTMKLSTDHCKIPSPRGGYKWPKLAELYKILFNEEMTGAHDALFDIKAMARCFFEMKHRGWIDLEKIKNEQTK